MSSQSSIFSLRMLNLWIGLCRGTAGLPKILFDMGYRDQWIESSFETSEKARVNPELIIASREQRHTILLEWKSGANTDADQLKRYALVKPSDLISSRVVGAELCDRVDITVVGYAEHADRLKKGLVAGGHSFPLFLCTEQGLLLAQGHFSRDELTKVLDSIPIDWSLVPTMFVPFDQDSNLTAVAEAILTTVLEFVAQARPRITGREIFERTVPTAATMGDTHQKNLLRKIGLVVDGLAKQELAKYLRRNKTVSGLTKSDTWDVIASPSDEQLRLLLPRVRKYFAELEKGQRHTFQLDIPETVPESAAQDTLRESGKKIDGEQTVP